MADSKDYHMILVVDDDSGLRDLVQKTLHREGFKTAAASTGAEAMSWLKDHEVDLMLLDFKLPDMTGKAVVNALNQEDRLVPFILVTGQGDEKLAAEMFKTGARDYLMKDSSLLDLLPVVVNQTLVQLKQEQQLLAAEQALCQSEAQYRGVFNAAGDGMLVLDSQGNILDANPHACSMYGYSQQELVQRSVRNLIHADQMHLLEQFFIEIRRQGCFQAESVHFKKNQAAFDVEIRGTRFDFSGQPHFLAIIRDISERKWAEEELRLTNQQMRISEQALREREARLRAIFQDAPIGIALIDLGGRAIESNEELQAMLGYSKNELRNMIFTELIYPDDRDRCLTQFQELASGTRCTAQSEHRCQKKNGHRLWIRMNASLICGDDDNPNYVIAILEDITERMCLEEELRTFAAQIERSNRELGQFAYFASHDLRQPLKNIIGFCDELMQSGTAASNPSDREFIEFIMENASRMNQLIHDLLIYSRLETRGDSFTQVDLNNLFRDVLEKLDKSIKTCGARIHTDPLPQVFGDPKQLSKLFEHLIENALKFRAEQTPEITLSLDRSDDKQWRLGVRDNGIGIPPKYHERIFLMFQKLHSKEDYPGTGIGLSISKKIVERHGGRIWVESQPGQGSTFFLTLPEQEGPEHE